VFSCIPQAGLQGVRGLFNAAAGPDAGPRCRVQLHDPYVFESVDRALSEMAKLVGHLLAEFTEYWGPVGVSTDAADLHSAMVKAFQWQELLQLAQPAPEHVAAFKFLLRRFKPLLSRLSWPDPATFGHVERRWSSDGTHEMQYLLLVHSVKEAAREPAFRTSWFAVKHFVVELVGGRSRSPVGAEVSVALAPLWRRLSVPMGTTVFGARRRWSG
jgi:hypothetical protein